MTEDNKSTTPDTEQKPADPATESPVIKKAKGKGRPPRKDAEPLPWSIRGVDIETRNIITKACEKRSLTVGQFFNQEIREYATGIVKRSGQPPASPKDIEDIINSRLTAFEQTVKQNSPEQIAAAVIKMLETKTTPENTTFLQRLAALFKG